MNKPVTITGNSVVTAANDGQATFTIASSDVTLEGFGIEAGRGIVVRSGSENVVLENMSVKDSSSVGILVETGCDGIKICNTEIREAMNDGIRISSTHDISLEDNFSNRNLGHGIRLDTSDGAMLTGNRSLLNRFHGFRLDGSNFVLASNDAVENSLRGFALEDGSQHMLTDNLARENGSHGISLDRITFTTLFDNRSRFNGATGIRVWDNSNFNLLDDDNVTGNGSHGILFGFSKCNGVFNQFIFENERSGLLLTNSTRDITATDNVIRSNLEFGIGDFGENVTEGNIVRDNGR